MPKVSFCAVWLPGAVPSLDVPVGGAEEPAVGLGDDDGAAIAGPAAPVSGTATNAAASTARTATSFGWNVRMGAFSLVEGWVRRGLWVLVGRVPQHPPHLRGRVRHLTAPRRSLVG